MPLEDQNDALKELQLKQRLQRKIEGKQILRDNEWQPEETTKKSATSRQNSPLPPQCIESEEKKDSLDNLSPISQQSKQFAKSTNRQLSKRKQIRNFIKDWNALSN